MAAQVPKWRTQFLTEPEYFRKVYKYVYDLGRLEGAKVVGQFSFPSFKLCSLSSLSKHCLGVGG